MAAFPAARRLADLRSGRHAADVRALAIAHVEVLDLAGKNPLRYATVTVEGDQITAVRPFDRVAVPNGATVVDGAGKFLIPGLYDMHVHFTSNGATVVDGAGKFLIPGLYDMHVHFTDARSMLLFLADGVTGVRVMWGNPSFGLPQGPYDFKWREEIEKGQLLGPRMVVASKILDGPKPIVPGSEGLTTPEQGREAGRKAKAAAAHFI
jgi:hypothetical protein